MASTVFMAWRTFLNRNTRWRSFSCISKILPPGGGLVDVEAGEYPLFHQLAIQLNLRVTSALKLLEDHLVHTGTRIH